MKEIKAFVRPSRLQEVLHALHEHPQMPGVTVSQVTGFGRVIGREDQAGPQYDSVEMCKLECLVHSAMVDDVIDLIRKHASTGRPGDGKIAVMTIERVVRLRDGAIDAAAI